MDPEPVRMTHYGMNRELHVVQRGTVSLARALEVANEYRLKLKPKYDSGEEAVAETLFGFARSKNSFIEICFNKPNQISLKFENPYRKPVLFWHIQAYFQGEVVLSSMDRLAEEITLFFTIPAAEYQLHFATLDDS